ncbi:glycoside hydrolase family 30 protein [Exidia glandulosa HHB12029]|uniref:Glycoside hydrolase family 30 protein n=1 Tax=Exidia glandulosa HHB12029 TaxID=1314781 RepID=A0A165N5R5_EXIGL|nr:glycoside hydrolase family 30 protein [Exidia glandulosa HHB12029]
MRITIPIAALVTLLPSFVHAQTSSGIWLTKWDRSSLFKKTNKSFSFADNTAKSADANIVIDESTKYQVMDGFGAGLTDSSAQVFNDLKQSDEDKYWTVLKQLFDPSQDVGLNTLRVPVGASDFSAKRYTLDDSGSIDTSLDNFNADAAPSALYETLLDIQTINPYIKLFLAAWTAPAWMKTSNSTDAGQFKDDYAEAYANYWLKTVQAYKAKGLNVYTVSLQNEPLNENKSYPTMKLTADQEAKIGNILRPLLDQNDLSDVKLIAFDHNWDNPGYPKEVMQKAGKAFAGAAWHCYNGGLSDSQDFISAYPDAENYFTECTGTFGTDWWKNLKYYLDNITLGSPERGAKAAMFWNIALTSKGEPLLPNTSSCRSDGKPICRPVVSLDGDTISPNEEYYALAHANRAVLPKDAGGAFGQRIKTSVDGSVNWALRVIAYEIPRLNPAAPKQYSLLVLNWQDGGDNGWNPQPVKATIEFQGKRASYSFDVGITTILWDGPGDENAPAPTSSTDASAPTSSTDAPAPTPTPTESTKPACTKKKNKKRATKLAHEL